MPQESQHYQSDEATANNEQQTEISNHDDRIPNHPFDTTQATIDYQFQETIESLAVRNANIIAQQQQAALTEQALIIQSISQLSSMLPTHFLLRMNPLLSPEGVQQLDGQIQQVVGNLASLEQRQRQLLAVNNSNTVSHTQQIARMILNQGLSSGESQLNRLSGVNSDTSAVRPTQQAQQDAIPPSNTGTSTSTTAQSSSNQTNASAPLFTLRSLEDRFPVKLYRLLEQAENDDFSDVITWRPDGKAFVVRNSTRFLEQVAPRFFSFTSYSSFIRQLHLYGFEKLGWGDSEYGAYMHDQFERGNPDQVWKMTRKPRPKKKKS